MSFDLLTAVLLVVLGGLFGYYLGRLPERWVYAITLTAIVTALVVFTRGG